MTSLLKAGNDGLGDALAKRIEVGPDGCWQWTGHIHKTGYGWFNGNRGEHATRLAHRLVAAVLGYPLGPEMHHECRNIACVNPEHLRPVTAQEHHRHHEHEFCIHGHPMAEAYIVHRHGVPGRQCRTCKKEVEKRRRAGWTEERRAAVLARSNERRRQRKRPSPPGG